MHRMHHLVLAAGLILSVAGACTPSASASLLKPDDTRAYPDVTAFANGYQSYTYDPSSRTGVFQLANVPFLVTSGTDKQGNFIESDMTASGAGLKSQTITAVLDASGNLVASARNSFQVYGKVTVGGQTYDGLLLSGTPTAFGSQTLKPSVSNEDLFDMTLKITGGTMASLYGPDAYVRVTSEANSTFTGVFTSDFSSQKVLTNTHAVNSLIPAPVPEPTALVVLLAAGAGLLYRGRRRISLAQLQGRV